MTDRPHSESSIVDNRRSHLSSEVPAAGRRIAEREHDQAELDQRRARIMALLRARGALEQLTQLQGELSRIEAQAETLRQALGHRRAYREHHRRRQDGAYGALQAAP